jgi:hypothetical protein
MIKTQIYELVNDSKIRKVDFDKRGMWFLTRGEALPDALLAPGRQAGLGGEIMLVSISSLSPSLAPS